MMQGDGGIYAGFTRHINHVSHNSRSVNRRSKVPNALRFRRFAQRGRRRRVPCLPRYVNAFALLPWLYRCLLPQKARYSHLLWGTTKLILNIYSILAWPVPKSFLNCTKFILFLIHVIFNINLKYIIIASDRKGRFLSAEFGLQEFNGKVSGIRPVPKSHRITRQFTGTFKQIVEHPGLNCYCWSY
jgi:hypothetical protein